MTSCLKSPGTIIRKDVGFCFLFLSVVDSRVLQTLLLHFRTFMIKPECMVIRTRDNQNVIFSENIEDIPELN